MRRRLSHFAGHEPCIFTRFGAKDIRRLAHRRGALYEGCVPPVQEGRMDAVDDPAYDGCRHLVMLGDAFSGGRVDGFDGHGSCLT